MIKYLKKAGRIGVALLIWLLSYLVPKKKGRLTFFPGHEKHKFSGDLKYFFLYINNTATGYDGVWVTDNDLVFSELLSKGYNVKKYLYFPFWEFLRAEKILLDTANWFLPFGNFALVQLWHGTGFKKIGILNKNNNVNYKSPVVQAFLRKNCFFLASSKEDMERKQAAYNCANVVIAGSPRNDVFFGNRDRIDEFREKYGLDSFDQIVLYAPTFRKNYFSNPFSSDFFSAFQKWAETENIAFVIKRHPADKTFFLSGKFHNIVDLTDSVADVQELLLIADMLVSDYSAIVTDFVLTGRPILFYVYDYKEYLMHERSLYYDLWATLPGPFVITEEDLMGSIADQSWFFDNDYQARYREFVERFHAYREGDYCSRLLELLQLQEVCS